MVYPSILKYMMGGDIKYINCVDNKFNHIFIRGWIESNLEIKILYFNLLPIHNKNEIQIQHNHHTKPLSLLLILIIRTTASYSYLSIFLIIIVEITSVVFVRVDKFLLLATGTIEEAGHFSRNINKLENIGINPTNNNFLLSHW